MRISESWTKQNEDEQKRKADLYWDERGGSHSPGSLKVNVREVNAIAEWKRLSDDVQEIFEVCV